MNEQQRETMRAEFVVWCADHMQISIAEVLESLDLQKWTEAEEGVWVRWETWQAATEQAGALKDAERYRWLRAGERFRQGLRVSGGGSRLIPKNEMHALLSFTFWCEPEELDLAIDAAIAATQGEKGGS